jgi:uncharacterized protein YgiM (DUF1202 family)
MVRTALMFVVALAGVTLLVSPDANWVPAPVAATVEPVAVAEALDQPATFATDETAPSFIVPVKRVAFPTMPASVAELPAAVETVPALSGDVRTVTAEALNIRDRPSSSSNVLGKLVAGDSVTVVGQERTWLEVVTVNGTTGWISGKFVKTPS